MNTTITGRVICAGRLVDNTGNFFDGIMIETGVDELRDKSIPFYQDVVICKENVTPIAVSDEKNNLIEHILRTQMTDANCRAMIETITIITSLNK